MARVRKREVWLGPLGERFDEIPIEPVHVERVNVSRCVTPAADPEQMDLKFIGDRRHRESGLSKELLHLLQCVRRLHTAGTQEGVDISRRVEAFGLKFGCDFPVVFDVLPARALLISGNVGVEEHHAGDRIEIFDITRA